MIHSWQEESWTALIRPYPDFAHAFLFLGPEKTGRQDFVLTFAQSLLCQKNKATKEHLPCRVCQSCRFFAEGTHPDFYRLAIQEEDPLKINTAVIKIDQIRDISKKIHNTSYLGGNKIIFIYPADALNLAAANSLLKMLEEPPPHTYFLLLVGQRRQLIPTLRSRCQIVHLPRPEEGMALPLVAKQVGKEKAPAFLALTSGSPFVDPFFPESLHQDLLLLLAHPKVLTILKFAERYSKEQKSLDYFLNWLYKWLIDMIALKEGFAIRFYPGQQVMLQQRLSNYSLKDLWQLADKVAATVPFRFHPLNTRLQIESYLLTYLLNGQR